MKEEGGKTGTLYVVATPIGNLEDITLRAIRILKEVSLIAAEDTRRTKKLLNVHGIRTPLTSLHDHTERSKSPLLIRRMKEGEDVAYVSEAGTPGISDPGYILIHRAITAGVRVVPVPGASAAIAALSVAGLPMDRFVFIGFPPSRSSGRRPFLESLRDETRTMVFYESPRRLVDLVRDMGSILGNRKIVLARELTKMFEEVQRGTVQDILDVLEGREVKGEVTLIVAGREKTEPASSLDDIALQFLELRKEAGISLKDMVRKITASTGLPRKTVYREVLRLFGKSPVEKGGENP
jgi:16S rRNA (cytidine1402-2'-O)-methyltransferase